MLKPEYPIETARLTIRPFVETDLDALDSYHRLPEVARYLYWEPRTREETEQALRKRIERLTIEREGDILVLAVVLRETGELLGDVNLSLRSEEHRTGEFGFIFDPRHHGHGYAGEAAVEMLRLGFEGLDLHRIIGRCDRRNTASAKLMSRLGLRKEAHFVENEMVKGEWVDELVFAMLAEEWAARP